nr:hypothetical protein [Tanacetum cinerariifolium]
MTITISLKIFQQQRVMQHEVLPVRTLMKQKNDETNDFNDSDMDLSEDEPRGDDDATGLGV